MPPPHYPIPGEVARLLSLHRHGEPRAWHYASLGIDHPALAFYRLAPLNPAEGYVQPPEDPRLAGHATQYLLALRDHFNKDGVWRKVAAGYAERLRLTAERLVGGGLHVRTFDLSTAGRLVVGLGYKGSLEVGFTFHHPGGFPYLPGTAVKGVCRAWAELEAADAPSSASFAHIFGTATKDEREEAQTMRMGAVRFYDALPVGFPRLDVDLMNPHYPEYYAGSAPPADWLNPTPISFLTVAAGASFRFVLASHDAEAVEQAETWLRDALQYLGAGGKTAAGYGLFGASETTPAGSLPRYTPPPPPSQGSFQGSGSSPDDPPPPPPPPPKEEVPVWREDLHLGSSIRAQVVRMDGGHPIVHLAAAGHGDAVPLTLQRTREQALAPGDWVLVTAVGFNSNTGRVTQVNYTGPSEPGEMRPVTTGSSAPVTADPNAALRGVVAVLKAKKGRIVGTIRTDAGAEVTYRAEDAEPDIAEGTRVAFELSTEGGVMRAMRVVRV